MTLVLDVAGGKGELAMELGFRGMPHIVIDPRPLGVDKMVKKLTLGWIKRHLCSCTDFDANDVCTKLWKGKEIPQAARDLMSRTKHIVHVPLPEAHLREYFWYPESPVKDCPRIRSSYSYGAHDGDCWNARGPSNREHNRFWTRTQRTVYCCALLRLSSSFSQTHYTFRQASAELRRFHHT